MSNAHPQQQYQMDYRHLAYHDPAARHGVGTMLRRPSDSSGTFVYENGNGHAWPSNDVPHYAGYPPNELTLLQAQSMDQVHVWQDSTTGGTFIHYLGRTRDVDDDHDHAWFSRWIELPFSGRTAVRDLWSDLHVAMASRQYRSLLL